MLGTQTRIKTWPYHSKIVKNHRQRKNLKEVRKQQKEIIRLVCDFSTETKDSQRHFKTVKIQELSTQKCIA